MRGETADLKLIRRLRRLFLIIFCLCVLAAASCLGEVMTKTEAKSDAGSAIVGDRLRLKYCVGIEGTVASFLRIFENDRIGSGRQRKHQRNQ